MCGIILAIRKDGKEAKRTVWKRYRKQWSRGYNGFGFVEVHKDNTIGVHRATDEDDIEEKLNKSKAGVVMFHHRYPTSLPNIIEATHPIKVSHKTLKMDYFVIHNGVINNDELLHDIHIKQGFKYTTECKKTYNFGGHKIDMGTEWNDSEAFAIELVQAIESGATKLDVLGSIAFIALAVDKATKKARTVYYGRNEKNPLKRLLSAEMFTLASEGSGADVMTHALHSIDLRTGKEAVRGLEIGDKVKPVGYGIPKPYSYNFSDFELPTPKTQAQDYKNESEYLFMCDEYERMKKRYKSLDNLNTKEADDLNEQIEELGVELEWYEGNGIKNSKSTLW